jgi:hypothetical protein
MYAVASALLPLLRTGNAILDSLLASALLTLLARAPAIWAWLCKKRVCGPVHSVTIRDDPSEPVNMLFFAARRKLSALLERTGRTGRLDVCVTTSYTEYVMPEVNDWRIMWHQGVAIRWCLATAESKQRTFQKYVLESYSAAALARFTDEAMKEYRDWLREPRVWTFRGKSWKPQTVHRPRTFNNLAMDPGTKSTLLADIDTFPAGEDWYASKGLDWKRGYLLHGPPGTGKTSVIRAMGDRAKADVYIMNLRALDSDEDMSDAFNQLPSKCIVVFEDIDCMGKVARLRPSAGADPDADPDTASTAATVSATVVGGAVPFRGSGPSLSALLNQLDGVVGAHGRIVVMTSNHPEVLDPALVRPGRVDLKVHLGLCTAEMLDELQAMFYPDNPRRSIPPDAYSPAQVVSAFMAHRDSLADAIDFLTQ